MKRFEEIIKESIPTLVVFEHAGHQDAVQVKYVIDSLRKKYEGRANVYVKDCSYNGNVKLNYKLKEYPTYILFKEGEELMRESGDKTEAHLEDMIVRAL